MKIRKFFIFFIAALLLCSICFITSSADPLPSSDVIGWMPIVYNFNDLIDFIEGSEYFLNLPDIALTNSIVVLYNSNSNSYYTPFDISYDVSSFSFVTFDSSPTHIFFLVRTNQEDNTDNAWIDYIHSNYPVDSLSVYMYNEGYYDGNASGGSIDTSYAYNQGVNDGMVLGLEEGFNNGVASLQDELISEYNRGKSEGYAQAESDEKIGISYIWALASVPVSMLGTMLNYEFLGINLFSIITGLLTLFLAVWIIKKVVLK